MSALFRCYRFCPPWRTQLILLPRVSEMKYFICNYFCSLTVLTVLLTGCAGKNSPAEKTPQVRLGNFSVNDEDSGMKVAGIFAESFGKSLISGDFKHLEPHLPPIPGGKKFTAPDFAQMRDAMITLYGTPRKLAYVTTLNQGKLRDMLWKITFEQQGKDGKAGEIREILLCVRVFKEDGKSPEVAGFFIKRF